MCKKVNFKFGFEVRYQAKQFFYLQDIQVEPVPNTTRGRVRLNCVYVCVCVLCVCVYVYV